jgi:hypothetical protein
MPNSKKDCLQGIVNNFLTEFDKLNYVEKITIERARSDSFFLSSSDVSKIRGRKSVLDELFLPIVEDILHKKVHNNRRSSGHSELLVGNAQSKMLILNERIKTMTDDTAGQILTDYLKNIEPIFEAKAVNREPTELAASMRGDETKGITAYDQKKSALMEHSFNDKWVFNFLAKLVKTVQEALGVKTSSEKLLEESSKAASDVIQSPSHP